METLLAFILAMVQYIIGAASWIVWGFITLMELVCWLLAIALIYHAFNVLTN
jgi:hypothetical protein